MKSGLHYGTIPGCGSKPTLLLPGAQKLAVAFQLTVEPEVEVVDHGRRASRIPRPVSFGFHERTASASGLASAIVIRWNRNIKKPPQDLYNTCEKMAKKRAFVDAVLTTTGASDHFTQDIEDNPSLYGGTEPKATQSNGGNQNTPGTRSDAPEIDGDTLVNFGKYKGTKFSELPGEYLQWCVDNASKDYIVEAARKEIDRREMDQSGGDVKTSDKPPAHNTPATEDQIRRIHEACKEAKFEILEVLDMFDLESTDQIRDIDVGHVLKWISDPSATPSLPAF
jgi:hypothetical protein